MRCRIPEYAIIAASSSYRLSQSDLPVTNPRCCATTVMTESADSRSLTDNANMFGNVSVNVNGRKAPTSLETVSVSTIGTTFGKNAIVLKFVPGGRPNDPSETPARAAWITGAAAEA